MQKTTEQNQRELEEPSQSISISLQLYFKDFNVFPVSKKPPLGNFKAFVITLCLSHNLADNNDVYKE